MEKQRMEGAVVMVEVKSDCIMCAFDKIILRGEELGVQNPVAVGRGCLHPDSRW